MVHGMNVQVRRIAVLMLIDRQQKISNHTVPLRHFLQNRSVHRIRFQQNIDQNILRPKRLDGMADPWVNHQQTALLQRNLPAVHPLRAAPRIHIVKLQEGMGMQRHIDIPVMPVHKDLMLQEKDLICQLLAHQIIPGIIRLQVTGNLRLIHGFYGALKLRFTE
ncbi:hypothetical protein D3C73_900000 [compost metagenome]